MPAHAQTSCSPLSSSRLSLPSVHPCHSTHVTLETGGIAPSGPTSVATRHSAPWVDRCAMPPHIVASRRTAKVPPSLADTRIGIASMCLSEKHPGLRDAAVTKSTQRLSKLSEVEHIEDVALPPASDSIQQWTQWPPRNNECRPHPVKATSSSHFVLLPDTITPPNAKKLPQLVRPTHIPASSLCASQPADNLHRIFTVPNWAIPRSRSRRREMTEPMNVTQPVSPCSPSHADGRAVPSGAFAAADSQTDGDSADLDVPEHLFDSEDLRSCWRNYTPGDFCGSDYDDDDDLYSDGSSTAHPDEGQEIAASEYQVPDDGSPPLALIRVWDRRRTPRHTPQTLSRFHPLRNLPATSPWRYDPAVLVRTSNQANRSKRYQRSWPCDSRSGNGKSCGCSRCRRESLSKSLLLSRLCQRRKAQGLSSSLPVSPQEPTADTSEIVRVYYEQDEEDECSSE